MKDFNECLQIFCKQLLKYSEEALRGRCETAAIQANQYRHLIYLKEMETIYYRSKCEQFLKNVDVIVNAKMSHKGNHIIYELDVTNRELRSLKDHYYLMEKFMREEIRREFSEELHEKDNAIVKLTEDNAAFRLTLSGHLSSNVAEEMVDAEQLVKHYGDTFDAQQEARSKEEHKKRTQPRRSKQVGDVDLDAVAKHKASIENYQEILRLQKTIRQMKDEQMMKDVINTEKYERDMAEMQQKLTMNSSLWEQLAESQKREQITRSELELTKQNLTHYEKLIEKLYSQLEHLNNQKIRLQQYKNSKAKRIGELENKMKDLEILENIDLNKILSELRDRDKKIARLDIVDKEFNDRMSTVKKSSNQQYEEMKRKFEKERAAKIDAFDKLESMRIEMKALEGKDIKNDLWKDKCKELYEISREMEAENDSLRDAVKLLQTQQIEDRQMNQQLAMQNEETVKIMHSRQLNDSQRTVGGVLTGAGSTNRNQMTLPQQPSLRENMILQRQNFTKPLTEKVSASNLKRAQSSNPNATQRYNANRIGTAGGGGYNRNMIGAQSHNYDRKRTAGRPGQGLEATSLNNLHMHDATNTITSNGSFPAFSSDAGGFRG